MPGFTFGPFELDPEARVLRRNGEPIPMAGKTLDTLLVLVENRGRLIDKDELLARVWAGSVVEEANLTQSIFTVRKILGDNPKDHRYIATVAGRGYQFVAPVVESTPGTQTAHGDLKKPRRFWVGNRVLQFGTAGLLIVVLVGIASYRVRHAGRKTLFAEPVPLTSAAGFAEDPAFSPKGDQIAYSWSPEGDANSSIYVKLIDVGTELRLTRPPGTDTMPAWSPDGRYIAFYRNLRGHSGYYLVSTLGGPVRQLLQVEFANSYLGGALGRIAWFPDGRHVALALPTRGSETLSEANVWSSRRIVRLDVESTEQMPLTRPSTSKLGDAELAISPNGKMLAFVQAPGAGAEEIYLLPLDRGGQPRRLTNFGAVYLGIAWSPDGKDLIFAMEQNGRRRLWRLPISGGVAYPITSSLEMISSPTVARQGDRLAYVVYTGSTSLWNLEILRAQPPTAAC
ncbi:MAG: winged helix-turn-helix domain-containing protein [Bryobacteraceae bacterium]